MRAHHLAGGLAALAAALLLAACGGSGETISHSAEGTKATDARKGGGGGGVGGNGGGGRSGHAIAGAVLTADAGVRSLTLSWSDNGASQYNVYLSSRPGCDIARYARCPDGRMVSNARSPHKVETLVNGRVYYGKVEGLHGRRSTPSAAA